MALPAVSGTASGMALELPGVDAEAFNELVGAVTVDYRTAQINAMTVPVLDRDSDNGVGNLTQALIEGTWINFGTEPWQVIAQGRGYRAAGVQLSLDVQSRLGAALRADRGPRGAKDITPGTWIERRAKANGGNAVVQPGAKRRQIVQKRNESTLATIEALSSDMGTTWCEIGGTLYVGTPWWAYEGSTNLPTWSLPLSSEAVMSFAARTSSADDANRATASLTVPNEVARQLRPWHRIDISKAAPVDNGMWLVDAVRFDLHRTPGEVDLIRPRRSTVNKGSSSTTDAGDGTSGLDLVGTPVKGSTFSDAKRPAGWNGRSVEQILTIWQANKTRGLGNGIFNACLFTSQEIAYGPGRSMRGDDPHTLIGMLGSRLNTSRTVVPGAVILIRNSRVGHAIVYLGGGRALSTDYPRAYQWNIGPVDAIINAFGTYAGWYAP